MKKYQSIVVLTGAGVSAESGIRTFRAADGLWEDHRVEDVATPEAFARDPELVQRFYNERRRPIVNQEVHPNPAHKALAKLEQEFSGEYLLVTQNIDNLHEQAGSQKVLHMHGEIMQVRCRFTDCVYPCQADVHVSDACECCGLQGALRPNIVWFGEMPFFMDEIYAALAACDLFVSVGTSGHVYPAAGFVQIAKQSGADTIEINLERSQQASAFNTAVYGKAGETLPAWIDELLAENAD